MRTCKFMLQLCIATSLICFFVSCSGTTTTSQPKQQEEPFWEGQVKPGVYTGSWYDNLFDRKDEWTLTIYDDETVKLKEVSNTGYHTYIEVSTGYIYKYVETYNGERKVWYGIDTHPEPGSTMAQSMNISTSLEFSPGNWETYQDFNDRRGYYGKLKTR